MFTKFVRNIILKTFFNIELTSGERDVAEESVSKKYAKALQVTFYYLLLAIFPIIFLDTTVIISVLIPITMVAGTAWFSISLANMKQKFGDFGLELTTNLFEAFTVSLGLLLALSVFSLSSTFWNEKVAEIPYQSFFQFISFVLGSIIVGNITYKIFIGSIKYDINDAMLTGQNEAAEKFYRKSLSLLHSVADTLRQGKSLQVANYYIGVAFFEIFSYMKKISVMDGTLAGFMEKSNQLVENPSMKQSDADAISSELINTFVSCCVNPQGHESYKSLQAIKDELFCLNKNPNEAQEMIDTRFAIIFQEIASLLEGQGDNLFTLMDEPKKAKN